MPATLHNALLVLVVQSLSTLLPVHARRRRHAAGAPRLRLRPRRNRDRRDAAAQLQRRHVHRDDDRERRRRVRRALPRCSARSAGGGSWRRRGEGVCSRAVSAQPPHPVRIVVTDDLRRSRLTVFFRLLPRDPALHLGVPARAGGRDRASSSTGSSCCSRDGRRTGLHDFIAGYIRYLTHLEAYFLLAANPFPAFYLIGRRAVPGRPARSTRPQRAEPLEDVLPALPRDPGAADREHAHVRRRRAAAATSRAGSRSSSRSSPGGSALFRGRSPRGHARPARLLPRLRRPALGLPLPAHRPVPVRGPNAFVSSRAGAAARGRRPEPSADEPLEPRTRSRMSVTTTSAARALLVFFRLPIADPAPRLARCSGRSSRS